MTKKEYFIFTVPNKEGNLSIKKVKKSKFFKCYANQPMIAAILDL